MNSLRIKVGRCLWFIVALRALTLMPVWVCGHSGVTCANSQMLRGW